MSETKVVNFKDVKAHWDKKTATWDDDQYVYIGRYNITYRLPGSKFANPFPIMPDQGRGATLDRYVGHLQTHPNLVKAAIAELAGKTLVCWCRNPGDPANKRVCHGDILKAIIDEYEQEQRDAQAQSQSASTEAESIGSGTADGDTKDDLGVD